MAHDPKQSVLFQGADKALVATFDLADSTSDGGAPLLLAADRKLGLTAAVAEALADTRDARRVAHDNRNLVLQRVVGIACGYEDANDAARMGNDGLLSRLLAHDRGMASQPTLSRFENRQDRRALMHAWDAFADNVLGRLGKRYGRKKRHTIWVDLDPTDTETHGAQQLSLFNGHDHHPCYLPMLASVKMNGEPEHHWVAMALRPGNASGAAGALGLLRRLIPKIRQVFPHARIRVRLDGAFAGPEVLALLERLRVKYLVAMAKNARTLKAVKTALKRVRRQARQTGQTERTYVDFMHTCRSWEGVIRRVVCKVEVLREPDKEAKDNPRFVITNMPYAPEKIYWLYCQRATVENAIKEAKLDLALERLSCSSFLANQLRLLLVACAYALLNEVRGALRGTALERSTFGQLRLKLLKIGGILEESVRRIRLRLARGHAWAREYLLAATRLNAGFT